MTKIVLLFKAEQFSLFDEEVRVEGHARNDGTYVAPYTARRKKRHATETLRQRKNGAPDEQADIFSGEGSDVGARGQLLPEGSDTVEFGPSSGGHLDSPGEPAPDVVSQGNRSIDYDKPFGEIEVPDFGVQAGTSKAERKKLNAEALEILNSKPDGFSDEEKAALAKYSGQGGVGDSLNEYYTRPDIAAATWSVLRNLGIAKGNILEPSCGSGVFLATAPSGVKVTGVELDATSARIAGVLHNRHEVANSSLESFATSDVRQFDAIVGNAPFGLRGGLIKDDKPNLPTAEQYFLDTAIDKTKGGGIVALIVPTGIMDGANARAFRERILRKAEFVGAHRMPNTAFAHAHTGVTTDLVIFRKRSQDVANALSSDAVTQGDLKSLGLWNEEFLAGGYFSGSGQENVYGRPEAGWRAKAGMGNDFTVTGSMEGVAAHIAQFSSDQPPSRVSVDGIAATAGDDEKKKKKILNAAFKQPYEHAEPGDTKMIGGVTYVLQGEPPRWHRADGEESAPESVSDADDLAGTLDRLFERGRDGGDTNDLREGAQSALDEYVKKHGVPSRNKDLRLAAGADKRLWRLIGAVNKDGSYSDLVTGRKTVDDSSDFALVAARLAETQGGFTADDLAESWTGGNREAALDHLFASTQYAIDADGKTWMSADDFLAGNLWDRYDAMKAALAHEGIEDHYRTKYADQLKAIEEAIDPKTLDEVDFQINSAWIPVEMIAAWQNDKVRQYKEQYPASGWTPDPFEISFADGVYTLSGGLFERKLLDKYLNRTGVRKENLGHIEEMNQDFRDWLLSSEFRERIEDLYNRKFRGYKQKEHSSAPITVPSLQQSGRSVNAYHWAGVRWALEQGKGIIAADVGVGKAQPLDAKILTPTGWVFMGDIHLGDMVIAGDGSPAAVLGVYPQGEKNIYRVRFHDGSETECCDEHLWLTQTHLDRNNQRRKRADHGTPRVRQLSEIRRTMTYRGMKNHAIPMVGIVQFESRGVPIDPYVLGVLIGDGAIKRYAPVISNTENEIIEAVRARVPAGFILSEVERNGGRCRSVRIRRKDVARFSRNGISVAIEALGLNVLSWEKFIPNCYKFNAPGVRLEILQGLMDTDGYVNSSGTTVQFTSSSKRLAEDAQFVVQSLGGNATIKTKIPTFTYKGEKRPGREAFTVHMRMPPDIAPFLRSKKRDRVKPKSKYTPIRYIESVELVGRKQAQCIEVDHPSRLYVTDDFVVTHNTTRALILGKLLKAYGRAKKPAFIVPKSVLANWKAEIDDWFPGANVLIIGENLEKGRSDTAGERNEKYHLLSQNDYDFVLISQPSFNDLDLDPVKKWEYLNDDFWEQRREALGQAGDKRREKMRVAYDQAMANREFQKRTDAIYFNDLGIDALIVDEMAAFKNLYAAKARFGDTPKFLGGQGLSNRALDLNMKARWVREQNNGLGIYGLSATPTKNSPLEVYSMLSHIAPEEFESRGIRNSEEFLDRYCKFELDNILGTDGKIKEATITAGFKNLDELREVMQKYIDRQTAADVGLVIPKPEEHQHLVEMTERQKAVYAELREMAEKSKEEGDSTGDAHIFSIMDKMRKAAIDLELLDPKHAGERSPKYEAAADEIAKGAKDGGQVVFIDSVDSHQKLADLLEKKGIKRSEIGIINAQVASSATARQKISDAFNAGKLKAVIGNTATMGEGVNLQKGTTDIHHLDLPWDPASMQQRNGRGVRQGNINESVRIHSYIAKGSFDGYRYQTMMAKKDWMDLLWNGGNEVENLAREGAVSRDDMLVMLAANPDEARKQMEENKAAQMERIAAEGRKRAGDVFVRFQDMDRSYRSLKDHGTASAVRLKSKLEGLRSQLRADKWFAAKEALDAGKPALVQRDTGDVWHEGKAFEMDAGTDAPIYWWSTAKSEWVVTGVDTRKGHVMAREYGKIGSEARVFDLEKMHRGVRAVAYDPLQEKEHIARKALTVGVDDSVSAALDAMHKRREAAIDGESKARVAKAVGDAVAKAAEAHEWTRKEAARSAMRVAIRNALDGAVPTPAGGQDFSGDDMAWAAERIYQGVLMEAEGLDPVSVSTPAHLVGVGDQVMAALHDDLQGILKDKARSYQDHGRSGPYGLLDKHGNPVAFVSYEGRNHLDDHDLMLPTAENKARAVRAYVEAEQGRSIDTKYGTKGRTKGYVALGLEAKYQGFAYGAEVGNPWKSIGKALWGNGFEAEARQALERSSVQRMETASSMTDAAKYAEPLANIGHGSKVIWPKAALVSMWKAADRLGVLDSPLEGAVEFKTGQSQEGATRHLFGKNGRYPVRAALTELAKESGHTDLASAFIVKSESGFGDKVRALVGLRRADYSNQYQGNPSSVSYDRAVLEAIQHVADGAGKLGMKVSEFTENVLPALRDDPIFSRKSDKTVGDALNEALKNA